MRKEFPSTGLVKHWTSTTQQPKPLSETIERKDTFSKGKVINRATYQSMMRAYCRKITDMTFPKNKKKAKISDQRCVKVDSFNDAKR